jgi:archaemetzincin
MKKIIFIFLIISATIASAFYYFRETKEVHQIVDFAYEQINHTQHLTFKGRICVVLLGKFPPVETALVKRQIMDYYGFTIDSTIVIALPDSAYYAPKKRYKAIRLLHFLREIKPANCDKIIGLTTKDISASKGQIEDAGILGYGFLGGESCVVSTYRMGRKKNSEAKFRERLSKVALHEIGHTLGLPHCEHSPLCVMNDAKGTLRQIDKEKLALCPACLTRIDFVRSIKKVATVWKDK